MKMKMIVLAALIAALFATDVFPQGSVGLSPQKYVRDKQWQNVIDYGAKADGSTNDRAAIQSAIDALPDSGGVVFVPGTESFYRLDSAISVPSNVTLYGVGKASHLVLDTAARCNVIINADTTNGDTGIVITGLWIDGGQGSARLADYDSVTAHAGINAVQFKRAHKSIISGNFISRSAKDGIGLSNCTDIEVSGNQIWDCGEEGIAVAGTGSYGFSITGNHLVGQDTLYEDGSGQMGGAILCKAPNATISDNVIKRWGAGIDINWEGQDSLHTYSIEGNVFEEVVGSGIAMIGAHRGTIANNVFNDCRGFAIFLSRYIIANDTLFPKSITVTGNVVNNQQTHTGYSRAGYGVYADYGEDITISDNIFRELSGSGMYVRSGGAIITGNHITGAATSGILVDLAATPLPQAVVVTGNTADSCGGRGIYVSSNDSSNSHYVVCANNNAGWNTFDGIRLLNVSKSIIAGNVAHNNASSGIQVITGNDNAIYGNNCYGNTVYGMTVTGRRCTVFGNQLAGNTSGATSTPNSTSMWFGNKTNNDTTWHRIYRVVEFGSDFRANSAVNYLNADGSGGGEQCIIYMNGTDESIRFDAATDSRFEFSDNIYCEGLTINTMNFPTSDGSAGDQLTTNGSGGLSWTAAGGAAAGTADSIGVDTSGDGAIDAYIYSTAGAAAVVKEGSGITLTVDTDSMTIAAVINVADSSSLGAGVLKIVGDTIMHIVGTDTGRIYFASGEWTFDGPGSGPSYADSAGAIDTANATFQAYVTNHGAGETNTLSDSGTYNATSGFGQAAGKTGTALKVKGLLEGSGITITQSGDSANIIAATLGASISDAEVDNNITINGLTDSTTWNAVADDYAAGGWEDADVADNITITRSSDVDTTGTQIAAALAGRLKVDSAAAIRVDIRDTVNVMSLTHTDSVAAVRADIRDTIAVILPDSTAAVRADIRDTIAVVLPDSTAAIRADVRDTVAVILPDSTAAIRADIRDTIEVWRDTLQASFTVYSPADVNDTVTILSIGSLFAPSGITILSITVGVNDTSGTYALEFEEWGTTSDDRARIGYIDTVEVAVNSYQTTTTTFTDASIAAGNQIRIIIPSTTEDEIYGRIEYVKN